MGSQPLDNGRDTASRPQPQPHQGITSPSPSTSTMTEQAVNEVENSFSVSTIALVVYGFFGIVFLLLACFLFILGLTPTLPCCRWTVSGILSGKKRPPGPIGRDEDGLEGDKNKLSSASTQR